MDTLVRRGEMSWLVESGKATGLWGLALFLNTLLNRSFGMDASSMTLFGRIGDCITAIVFAARGVRRLARFMAPCPANFNSNVRPQALHLYDVCKLCTVQAAKLGRW
eukprot:SAG31_NODE_6560_length_1974_cov_2.083733_4_plen_107_part_00